MDKQGLYGKYRIARADGRPLRSNDRLFVLNYGLDDDDYPLDEHARLALAVYAASVRADNPQLTDDLIDALDEPDKAHSHEVDPCS
jgi:hypothetical protein